MRKNKGLCVLIMSPSAYMSNSGNNSMEMFMAQFRLF